MIAMLVESLLSFGQSNNRLPERSRSEPLGLWLDFPLRHISVIHRVSADSVFVFTVPRTYVRAWFLTAVL